MSNVRSATAIIADLREGQVVVELSEKIKTAIAAVKELGKPAVVRLDITIAPLRSGTENLIEAPLVFVGDVTLKLPKATPDATVFFVDQDGNPTRNPSERQQALGLSIATPATNNTAA